VALARQQKLLERAIENLETLIEVLQEEVENNAR
jgi:hypothetical protein